MTGHLSPQVLSFPRRRESSGLTALIANRHSGCPTKAFGHDKPAFAGVTTVLNPRSVGN